MLEALRLQLVDILWRLSHVLAVATVLIILAALYFRIWPQLAGALRYKSDQVERERMKRVRLEQMLKLEKESSEFKKTPAFEALGAAAEERTLGVQPHHRHTLTNASDTDSTAPRSTTPYRPSARDRYSHFKKG
eukprot:Lankesteria_metandrocarpae@DN1979_c0_g1_i1.p1